MNGMKVKAQLKDIVSYSKGSQINGDELLDDGKYDYLNGGVLPSGKWNEYNTEAETVTVSEGGNSCGFVNYMQKPFWCGAHCYYLYDSKVNTRYLYYILKSQQDRLMNIRSGACMPNIKKSDLGKFEVIYDTDSDEQQKVIDVLDRISSIITARQQQLQKLDELVKARFVEMFGDAENGESKYPIETLGNLSTKISDGVHAKPEYTEIGRPFLSVVNINQKKIDFTDCKFVSEEAYQKMIKSTKPEKGDVLYTKVGATYGIPAYVDTDTEFCLYVSVCLIKPMHEKINSRFLAIQMDTPFVKHQADKRIKGIGVPDLHLNQIREFQIICPPREMQDEFVHFVEQTDKSKFVEIIELLNLLIYTITKEVSPW